MTGACVKELFSSLGADLCGIASVDRFDAAPKGFHPLDVFPECKTVVSFACRFPVAALACKTDVIYTRVRNSLTAKVDAIALDACIELERRGIRAVPIPATESVLDEATGRKRSVVSQKHAAQAAGLGTIGRHSLLITPQFGSMVWLGAVLTNAELEADPLLESLCQNCCLCVDACPANALEHAEVNQTACSAYAFEVDPVTQQRLITCHKCRDACPHLTGTQQPFPVE